jgi:hypothetical protein
MVDPIEKSSLEAFDAAQEIVSPGFLAIFCALF